MCQRYFFFLFNLVQKYPQKITEIVLHSLLCKFILINIHLLPALFHQFTCRRFLRLIEQQVVHPGHRKCLLYLRCKKRQHQICQEFRIIRLDHPLSHIHKIHGRTKTCPFRLCKRLISGLLHLHISMHQFFVTLHGIFQRRIQLIDFLRCLTGDPVRLHFLHSPCRQCHIRGKKALFLTKPLHQTIMIILQCSKPLRHMAVQKCLDLMSFLHQASHFHVDAPDDLQPASEILRFYHLLKKQLGNADMAFLPNFLCIKIKSHRIR